MTATRRRARCRSTSTTTRPTVASNLTVFTDDETATTPDAAPNLGGTGDYDGVTPAANLTGTLSHSYGADGAGSTLLLGSGAPAGFTYTLSGGGTILTISQVQDGSPVNVLRVTLTNTTSGAYTVEQLAAIDHPTPGTSEENIQFAVGYQVTDHDGDTATGSLSIDVDDDTPTVASNGLVQLDDDALAGGNPGTPAVGDVDPDTANTSGTLAHSYGADGAGTTLLTGAGLPTSSVVEGAFIQALNGAGTLLTISQIQGGIAVAVVTVSLSNNTAGAYTVTQVHAIDHPAGLDENNQAFTINYTVTDHDGDTATGSLSIDVDDDTPTVTANAAVFRDSTTTTLVRRQSWRDGDDDDVTPSGQHDAGRWRTAMAPTAPARRC